MSMATEAALSHKSFNGSDFPIGGLLVQKAGLGAPRCFNCGETDHIARDCPVARSVGLGAQRALEVNREIGEWQELKDRANRRMVYLNTRTKQRTFEKPKAFMNMLELAREESSATNNSSADNTSIVSLLGQEKQRELASAAIFEQDKPEDQRTGYYEMITERDKLPPKNKGYMMLLKMGWKENTGLGKTFKGIKEPISINVHDNQLGLGKKTEYEEHNKVAAKERKKLEIEREETPELRKERAERKARLEDIQATLVEQNRKFYCALCDKQYKNAMEIQLHLSSYDHHHTKRLKEMKERERQRGGDAKLNKERAREEKRLRKLMAKANKARAEREKSVAQPPLPTETSQPPLPTDSAKPPLPPDAAQPPPPPRPAFSGFSFGTKKNTAKSSSKGFSAFSFGAKKKIQRPSGFSF